MCASSSCHSSITIFAASTNAAFALSNRLTCSRYRRRAACAFFTERFGKIDRIDSLNEYWLETEARLRTEFGVYGVQNDTIADKDGENDLKAISLLQIERSIYDMDLVLSESSH